MTDHILDLIDKPEELTPEQQQIVHLIQGHMTLQDQFNQLTKHVEIIYKRLGDIEKLVHSKVLA